MMQVLGGEETLGQRISSEGELERYAREGFPLGVLEVLQSRSVLTSEDVYNRIIPRRTLSHRQRRKERLSLDESNRVSRIARIFALAIETFGSEDRARKWLRRPLRQFGGRAPLELLATDLGAHQLEGLLGRIAHGLGA